MMTNKLEIDPCSEINEHLKTDKGLLTELFLIVLISQRVARCEIFSVNKHEEGDTYKYYTASQQAAGDKLSLGIIMITRASACRKKRTKTFRSAICFLCVSYL